MRIRLLLLFLFLAALVGCNDRSSERRLVEMAVKLERNSGKIEELSLAVEGISGRLVSIEESLKKLTQAPSPGEKVAFPPISPVGGAGNVELETVSRQVALLSNEIVATKEGLASAMGALDKIGEKVFKSKDGDEALHKLAGNPDKFAKALDRLVETVSPRMEDAAARQSFEAEIRQLRDRILAGDSPEQLYQELRGRMVEKLSRVAEEEDRRTVQREIEKLDTCTERELDDRLTEYARARNLDDLFRIAKTHGVQKEEFHLAVHGEPPKK